MKLKKQILSNQMQSPILKNSKLMTVEGVSRFMSAIRPNRFHQAQGKTHDLGLFYYQGHLIRKERS